MRGDSSEVEWHRLLWAYELNQQYLAVLQSKHRLDVVSRHVPNPTRKHLIRRHQEPSSATKKKNIQVQDSPRCSRIMPNNVRDNPQGSAVAVSSSLVIRPFLPMTKPWWLPSLDLSRKTSGAFIPAYPGNWVPTLLIVPDCTCRYCRATYNRYLPVYTGTNWLLYAYCKSEARLPELGHKYPPAAKSSLRPGAQ